MWGSKAENCFMALPNLYFPEFFSTGIRFLGCSEAKYQHDYGCDKELQNVDVKDKTEKKIKVCNRFIVNFTYLL